MATRRLPGPFEKPLTDAEIESLDFESWQRWFGTKLKSRYADMTFFNDEYEAQPISEGQQKRLSYWDYFIETVEDYVPPVVVVEPLHQLPSLHGSPRGRSGGSGSTID